MAHVAILRLDIWGSIERFPEICPKLTSLYGLQVMESTLKIGAQSTQMSPAVRMQEPLSARQRLLFGLGGWAVYRMYRVALGAEEGWNVGAYSVLFGGSLHIGGIL